MSTGKLTSKTGKSDMVVVYLNESDYKDLREIQERENRDSIAATKPFSIDELFKDCDIINVCDSCGHDIRDNDLIEFLIS